MSNEVFPMLPGFAWSIVRTPTFKTQIYESASGRELRIARRPYPKWKIELNFAVLRSGRMTELEQMMGMFLRHKGEFSSFLFEDPLFKTSTDMQIGVGDGIKTSFQLLRPIDGYIEPVVAAKTASITVNGISQTPSINMNSGLVSFATAPSSGALIKWSGSYYLRVRFDKDESSFEEFMKDIHKNSKIVLVTEL